MSPIISDNTFQDLGVHESPVEESSVFLHGLVVETDKKSSVWDGKNSPNNAKTRQGSQDLGSASAGRESSKWLGACTDSPEIPGRPSVQDRKS